MVADRGGTPSERPPGFSGNAVFQIMKDKIIHLLERKDYLPANVPELLRHLRLAPNRQQELQAVLRQLEQAGAVARIKGNRYIQPREADLIPGRIRMNRQGKGFLQPDDTGLKEIAIEQSATGTALHEDRVLVRRDVRAKGLRHGTTEPVVCHRINVNIPNFIYFFNVIPVCMTIKTSDYPFRRILSIVIFNDLSYLISVFNSIIGLSTLICNKTLM